MSKEASKPKALPAWSEFVLGGAAGVSSWAIIHPFDTLKTRMQVAGEGMRQKNYSSSFGFATGLVKNEGISTLYRGFSAAVIRQCTYATLRIGIYNYSKGLFGEDSSQLSLSKKVASGSFAGFFASLATCPVEVCLVRMQTDGKITDPAKRRNYRHVFDALFRIGKEEGIKTYWRGATPTVVRAVVVCATQLTSYDEAKHTILKTPFFSDPKQKDSVIVHLLASCFSGLFYSFCSLPFDIAKTRMQDQNPLPDGGLKYKNIFRSLFRIVVDEGFRSLWKGYLPYLLRCGGHTVGMFMFLEQYRQMLEKNLNK